MGDEPEPEGGANLGGLVGRASPAGGLAAKQSLAALESKLFGRRRQSVKVNRYVLVDRIASGGGGTVYSAYDPKLNRKVAVKLLHAGHDANRAQGRARLLREAQSLAKLSHPNIVEVYDVGTYDSTDLGELKGSGDSGPDSGVFVVMEFVEGSNLAEWLATKRRSWRDVRDVFVAAGEGLAAAHARGIVHRDFKPPNVLVGEDGRTRVLDFGLARATRDRPDSAPHKAVSDRLVEKIQGLAGPIDVSLTLTGAMLGTPAYMAPEQHDGKRADARSDQYSFCLAMYEGLYGCSPFRAFASAEVQRAKRDGDFALPPRDSRVPTRFLAVLHKGLSPDPNLRHEAMRPLLEELSWDPRHRRRGFLIAGGATVALATMGIAVWQLVVVPGGVCGAASDPPVGAEALANLGERLRSTGLSFAPDTATRVVSAVDDYSTRWVAGAVDACEATHVRGEQSDELLALRNLCLDERRFHLESLVAVFSEADATAVGRAIDAAGALPDLERCADIELLLAQGTLPPDATIAEAVAAIRLGLGRAAALQWAGQADEGLALARESVSTAKGLGYPPVEVEALYRRGSLEAVAVDRVAAERTLQEALWSAAGINHDEVASAAASRLVEIVGAQPGRTADGHLWARHAEAAGKRAALSIARRARLVRDLARMIAAEGRNEEALQQYERAAALLRAPEAAGIQHPERVAVLAGLGAQLAKVGRAEVAATQIEAACQAARDVYGPSHPATADIYRRWADVLTQAARPDAAREHYVQALKIFDDAGAMDDPRRRPALAGLGLLELANGSHRAAAQSLQAALGMTGPETAKKTVADIRFGLARARWRSGERDAKTQRLAAQARDAYEALGASGREPLRDVEAWLATRGVESDP